MLLVALHACAALAQTEGLQELNGTVLYVKTEGTGTPIVAVHGGPGLSHHYLAPQLGNLSKWFQVTFYDQRASGQSATPAPDEITLRTFAGDVDAIRKKLGHDQIYLLAHSWGALPAIKYGLLYPEQVKGIIFCNPIPFSREYDGEMAAAQQAKMSGADSTNRSLILGSPGFKAGEAAAYKKLLLLSFRHSFYKESNFSKLDLDVPDNYQAASQALYKGLGKELRAYDYYDSIKNFAFPVLILRGAVDVVPQAAYQRMMDALPTATLKVFRKSGHFIFMEQNRKFNRAVRKFVHR